MKQKTFITKASSIPTISGIYGIVNLKTQRIYIGSGKNLRRRFYEHSSALRKHKHYCLDLQVDWQSLGKESFEFIILELYEGPDLLSKETYYIQKFATNKYNSTNFATSKGFRHSEKTKEILRQKRLSQNISKESYSKALNTRLRNDPNSFSKMAKLGWEKIKNGEIVLAPRDLSTYQTKEFKDKVSLNSIKSARGRGRLFKCNETNKTFHTCGDCAREMNLKSYKTIWACLNKHKKSYNGFTFTYLDEIKDISLNDSSID